MKELPWQSLDRVTQLAQECVQRVARQLQGLLELQVQEVTLVHTLES